MTKEEAIHIIKNINANTNCNNCFYTYNYTCEDCRVETALNIAIEALEKEIIDCNNCEFGNNPSYVRPCCDCFMTQPPQESYFKPKENK